MVKSENGVTPDSAKIRMMMQLLKGVEEKSEKKEKTIVFSQFTSFLDLIEPFLNAEGMKYVRCESQLLCSTVFTTLC